MRSRPFGRRVQEFLDFIERLRLEVALFLCDAQHVPPRSERVQFDIDVLQHRHTRAWHSSVIALTALKATIAAFLERMIRHATRMADSWQ